MKKLILALILANLLYFAYSRFVDPEKEELVVYRGEKGVPLLVTLNELERPPAVTSHVPLDVTSQTIQNKLGSGSGLPSAPANAAQGAAVTAPSDERADAKPEEVKQIAASNNAPPAPSNLPGKGECLTIGPFSDLGVAKSARLALEDNKLAVKNRKEMRQIKGAFWVYLPAYSDKETAQAASKVLADNGIKDYFIISADEETNGISLGLYNKKSFADRRQTDIARLGFKPLVATRERQREYWWLDLETKSPIKNAAWEVDGLSKEIQLTRKECEV